MASRTLSQAQKNYAKDNFGVDLDKTVYGLIPQLLICVYWCFRGLHFTQLKQPERVLFTAKLFYWMELIKKILT